MHFLPLFHFQVAAVRNHVHAPHGHVLDAHRHDLAQMLIGYLLTRVDKVLAALINDVFRRHRVGSQSLMRHVLVEFHGRMQHDVAQSLAFDVGYNTGQFRYNRLAFGLAGLEQFHDAQQPADLIFQHLQHRLNRADFLAFRTLRLFQPHDTGLNVVVQFAQVVLPLLLDVGNAGQRAFAAIPPVWNVRIVNCVPGSPMDCAAMMPVATPMSTIRPVARSRP